MVGRVCVEVGRDGPGHLPNLATEPYLGCGLGSHLPRRSAFSIETDSIYNIASGVAVSFRHIIEVCKKILGSESELVSTEPPRFNQLVQAKNFALNAERRDNLLLVIMETMQSPNGHDFTMKDVVTRAL